MHLPATESTSLTRKYLYCAVGFVFIIIAKLLAINVETGKVVSAQIYGKQVYYSNTQKYNENDEFSAVVKVDNCNTEYEFSYEVKLVNFRGTEVKTVVVPGYKNGKTTTTVKEVAKDALNASSIKADVKAFLEEIAKHAKSRAFSTFKIFVVVMSRNVPPLIDL